MQISSKIRYIHVKYDNIVSNPVKFMFSEKCSRRVKANCNENVIQYVRNNHFDRCMSCDTGILIQMLMKKCETCHLFVYATGRLGDICTQMSCSDETLLVYEPKSAQSAQKWPKR
jgi:hypothetical protein